MGISRLASSHCKPRVHFRSKLLRGAARKLRSSVATRSRLRKGAADGWHDRLVTSDLATQGTRVQPVGAEQLAWERQVIEATSLHRLCELCTYAEKLTPLIPVDVDVAAIVHFALMGTEGVQCGDVFMTNGAPTHVYHICQRLSKQADKLARVEVIGMLLESLGRLAAASLIEPSNSSIQELLVALLQPRHPNTPPDADGDTTRVPAAGGPPSQVAEGATAPSRVGTTVIERAQAGLMDAAFRDAISIIWSLSKLKPSGGPLVTRAVVHQCSSAAAGLPTTQNSVIIYFVPPENVADLIQALAKLFGRKARDWPAVQPSEGEWSAVDDSLTAARVQPGHPWHAPQQTISAMSEAAEQSVPSVSGEQPAEVTTQAKHAGVGVVVDTSGAPTDEGCGTEADEATAAGTGAMREGTAYDCVPRAVRDCVDAVAQRISSQHQPLVWSQDPWLAVITGLAELRLQSQLISQAVEDMLDFQTSRLNARHLFAMTKLEHMETALAAVACMQTGRTPSPATVDFFAAVSRTLSAQLATRHARKHPPPTFPADNSSSRALVEGPLAAAQASAVAVAMTGTSTGARGSTSQTQASQNLGTPSGGDTSSTDQSGMSDAEITVRSASILLSFVETGVEPPVSLLLALEPVVTAALSDECMDGSLQCPPDVARAIVMHASLHARFRKSLGRLLANSAAAAMDSTNLDVPQKACALLHMVVAASPNAHLAVFSSLRNLATQLLIEAEAGRLTSASRNAAACALVDAASVLGVREAASITPLANLLRAGASVPRAAAHAAPGLTSPGSTPCASVQRSVESLRWLAARVWELEQEEAVKLNNGAGDVEQVSLNASESHNCPSAAEEVVDNADAVSSSASDEAACTQSPAGSSPVDVVLEDLADSSEQLGVDAEQAQQLATAQAPMEALFESQAGEPGGCEGAPEDPAKSQSCGGSEVQEDCRVTMLSGVETEADDVHSGEPSENSTGASGADTTCVEAGVDTPVVASDAGESRTVDAAPMAADTARGGKQQTTSGSSPTEGPGSAGAAGHPDATAPPALVGSRDLVSAAPVQEAPSMPHQTKSADAPGQRSSYASVTARSVEPGTATGAAEKEAAGAAQAKQGQEGDLEEEGVGRGTVLPNGGVPLTACTQRPVSAARLTQVTSGLAGSASADLVTPTRVQPEHGERGDEAGLADTRPPEHLQGLLQAELPSVWWDADTHVKALAAWCTHDTRVAATVLDACSSRLTKANPAFEVVNICELPSAARAALSVLTGTQSAVQAAPPCSDGDSAADGARVLVFRIDMAQLHNQTTIAVDLPSAGESVTVGVLLASEGCTYAPIKAVHASQAPELLVPWSRMMGLSRQLVEACNVAGVRIGVLNAAAWKDAAAVKPHQPGSTVQVTKLKEVLLSIARGSLQGRTSS